MSHTQKENAICSNQQRNPCKDHLPFTTLYTQGLASIMQLIPLSLQCLAYVDATRPIRFAAFAACYPAMIGRIEIQRGRGHPLSNCAKFFSRLLKPLENCAEISGSPHKTLRKSINWNFSCGNTQHFLYLP